MIESSQPPNINLFGSNITLIQRDYGIQVLYLLISKITKNLLLVFFFMDDLLK